MGIDQEMFVRVRRHVTAGEVRAVSIRLVTMFGAGPFTICRPGSSYGPKAGRHALSIEGSIDQDSVESPKIKPDDGEEFIRVHLMGRYYGIGYERGDLPGYLAIARFLRTAFEPCEIWYGGDSSGVEFVELTTRYENQMWKHFVGESGRNYYTRHSSSSPECDFCRVPLNDVGGGTENSQRVTYYQCQGCGTSFEGVGGKLAPIDHNFMREGKQKTIARDDLDDALLCAVAAMTRDETTIHSGDWSVKNGQDGRLLTFSIETSWRSLSHEERVAAFERATELMGARAEAELVKPLPEIVGSIATNARRQGKGQRGRR